MTPAPTSEASRPAPVTAPDVPGATRRPVTTRRGVPPNLVPSSVAQVSACAVARAPVSSAHPAGEAPRTSRAPAAAQKPLWDALADFRTHWKGREEQLTKPPAWEARGLERALELALLESQAWEIEEKDLQHLETLCSSDTCKVEIVRWRARLLRN